MSLFTVNNIDNANNVPTLTINGDFTYQQIGSDIDGEASGDESGYSVSLSVDGSVVAIGAPYNDNSGTGSGYVRIYKNINGVWTQIGNDIDGEGANDRSGRSVSLSADGSAVAIGAYGNDGNGSNSGHVRIYKNINGVWTQIGDDIDGEGAGDNSGDSVSLSADGSIVAIGAEYNDGNGSNSGHVRIYQNLNGVWTKIGNDIDGEATGDQSGRSVSLSADGSVVAISTPLNDNNTSVDFRNGGHARIYQNVNGIWTQIGDDIDGNFIEDLGASVSLSSDGSVVAIGSRDGSGFVRVYKNFNGTWNQIGDSIYGEASSDNSGHSVSLSADGSVVAIGAPNNDGNGQDSGHVRIYENQNGVWTQIGDDIDGEASSDNSGHSVSLSADGSVVAIGAPDNDGEENGKSGHVRIYQLMNTVTVEENQTAVTTATATDPDGTTPVYSLGGADGDLFNIDSNGVITFKVAPDYENPGDVGADNIYNVIVTATDELDSNLSTSQSLAIEVSDMIREPINRAPVLTINSNYRTYEQIGDFNGSGRSVSLSADGSVVAIGSSIYQNIDGIWSFLNSRTSGTGPSVLSADGSVIASGIPSDNAKGSNTGVVRIYEIVDDTSTLVGYIEGERAGDISGSSVSLSADGSVVAIGAPWNDDNGFQSGHVRIYENVNGVLTWTQIGDDIDGEVTLDRSGDESGTSVSLSADGSVVAIGAPYNDGNGSQSGHVRVYENRNGVWTQVGDDIDGEAEFNYSGTSVSLSADGSVVAIGSRGNSDNGQFSGHVRVYENVNGVWTQIGDDIDGEGAGDALGTSVSLSADGSVVVIGAEYNDGNGQDSGHAKIYENINGVWTQIGDDIDGEEAGDRLGYSVSLSADGSVTAIGGYSNDRVRIYQIIENVTISENQTMVTTATATDPDPSSATPVYSLSGTDANLFTIGTDGVITFKTAPDYENPSDADGDNVYDLEVIASDALNNSLSTSKTLKVIVSDDLDLFNLDIDGDGEISASVDGLLIYGYLNIQSIGVNSLVENLTQQLADNLINPNGTATRKTGAEITDYLESNIEYLDIDGDGEISASIDGLLVYGYLNIQGIGVDSLVNNLTQQLANNLITDGGTATRKTGADIAEYLESYIS